MKPSHRIKELYDQMLPQIDAQTRERYAQLRGANLTDADWLRMLDDPTVSGPIAMTARYFAIVRYLDERHEARKATSQ